MRAEPLRPLGLVALAGALSAAMPCGAFAGGARAEASGWAASIEAGSAVSGRPAVVHVRIVARDGFHVNEEYPLHFLPAASDTVAFAKARFDRADGLELEPCSHGGTDACVARLPVAFTPKAAGTLTVAGTVKFSVCNPEKCLIEQVELVTPVEAGS